MAIYEFKCPNCQKINQKSFSIISNRKKVKCDYCGELAERILSVTGGYKMKGYSEKNGYSGEKK